MQNKNTPRFKPAKNACHDGIGNVGDLISLPSSIAYMVTGDKRWDTASDAGQVLGVPAAAMQIYENWTPA